jgi:hypothetical protein
VAIQKTIRNHRSGLLRFARNDSEAGLIGEALVAATPFSLI